MQAAVLSEFDTPLGVEEVEPLPLGPRQVAVRPGAVELCVTDTYLIHPSPIVTVPTVLGHSAAGVVTEVGSAVAGIAPGDRVVVVGTPMCGACFWCDRGQRYMCREIFGAPPRHVARRADGTLVSAGGNVGTFAERVCVPDFGVVKVDSALPDEHLCLLSCGVTSAVGAVVNIAEVRLGDSVAVLGCGRIGGWIVQAARMAGAARIIVIEPREERRRLGDKLGATDLIDPADGDVVEQVRDLTEGRGVDCGFEAAADARAMLQTFNLTRRGGVVVPLGMTGWDETVDIPANSLAMHGKRVLSCQYGNVEPRRDLPRFARAIEAGLLDPAPMVSATFGLDQLNEAISTVANQQAITAIVRPTAMDSVS